MRSGNGTERAQNPQQAHARAATSEAVRAPQKRWQAQKPQAGRTVVVGVVAAGVGEERQPTRKRRWRKRRERRYLRYATLAALVAVTTYGNVRR